MTTTTETTVMLIMVNEAENTGITIKKVVFDGKTEVEVQFYKLNEDGTATYHSTKYFDTLPLLKVAKKAIKAGYQLIDEKVVELEVD